MDKLYLISKRKFKSFKNTIKTNDIYLHYNDLQVTHFFNENSKIIILGHAVHCKKVDLNLIDICKEMAEMSTLNEVIGYSDYLVGRYIIIRSYGNSTQILPDATCTIPVNFYFDEQDMYISSTTHLIGKLTNMSLSEESLEIKSKAEEQHPLPYNITMYNKVKTLIPNHLLNVDEMEMFRYYPNEKQVEKSFDFVLDETINVMDDIIERFVKEYKFSLPITSGLDSRLLLALMKDHVSDIPLYTFYDKGDEENWDLVVPKRMAEKLNLEHHAIERIPIEKTALNKLTKILDYQQNERILENGFSLSESPLSHRQFLAGDIIPIVKSNFGKNYSEKLATLFYLNTKTHNYSKNNKKHIKKWIKDAENDYDVSKFDLFFWEYRFGRWLPNNANNYDVFSNPFYIFNCRYLIKLWISISREERTSRSFHKEIIEKKWPELLEFPFNPGNKLGSIFSKNQYSYYLASLAKYNINRFR
ncbi:hypothetical protein GCM10008932_18320 [Alkalibacterium iburiense]|uniref:Asparagine synthetase domain-containing protein n=1 Tax=Alkalibacterium iburiense TaxID=290589 RepID=A0ABN0XL28_9LACT